MVKTIRQGECMPFWYGLIGPSPSYLGSEIAPIPINFIYRLWYLILRKTNHSKWTEKLNAIKGDMYTLGYERGWHAGRNEGFMTGKKAGADEFSKRLSEVISNKYGEN